MMVLCFMFVLWQKLSVEPEWFEKMVNCVLYNLKTSATHAIPILKTITSIFGIFLPLSADTWFLWNNQDLLSNMYNQLLLFDYRY